MTTKEKNKRSQVILDAVDKVALSYLHGLDYYDGFQIYENVLISLLMGLYRMEHEHIASLKEEQQPVARELIKKIGDVSCQQLTRAINGEA